MEAAIPETASHLNLFDTAAFLLVLAAVFSFVNHRYLRLPFTIGILVSGLAASLTVLVLDAAAPGIGIGRTIRQAVETNVDFHEFLMHGMLSFLLFAGALHVDLEALLTKKAPVLLLASAGLLISTAVVGVLSRGIFLACGVDVPFSYCLVFGALISPTDPIAVLGIMKSVGAPKSLEIKVAGESLFNDGIAVVVFLVLTALAAGGANRSGGGGAGGEATRILAIFAAEAGGGVVLGLTGGLVCYAGMKSLDDANLEVLFSVALVMGITSLAFLVHTSAPLACVVAGIFIGNHGRRFAMSPKVRAALDSVWSFLDEALNAILFLLIGLEVMSVTFEARNLVAAAAMIPATLLARLVSVAGPVQILRWVRFRFTPGAVRVLTWGGLKGGISVALALSLQGRVARAGDPGTTGVYEAILTATYAVVLFSIIVQGLTVGKLIERVVPGPTAGS